MDKCQKIIHPLEKGAVDYQCRKPHYKDGWCKLHHPEIVEVKAKRHAENVLLSREKNEKNVQRLFDLAQLKKCGLTIETAIVLLVQSGYRVEKLPPSLARAGVSQSVNDDKADDKAAGAPPALNVGLGFVYVLFETVSPSGVENLVGITTCANFARGFVAAALPKSGIHRHYELGKDVTP